ncbi:hypothetical protein BGP75_26160 [Motiliproteus sp. MSK22-1]|nr:hypothetical protein BGP75_26160 [Motiliproteus sp. MSK22-1]
MGEAYEYVKGGMRDGQEASKWYLIAAKQNHPLAQRNLAGLYDSGFGIPKDSWQAFKWYKAAAEQGQPHSQLMTGMMYLDGAGTIKDPVQGLAWIEKAAKSGEANAQYMYGKILYETDPVTALEWYQKSASQNNSYALYRLGLLYYRGEQIGPDMATALDYAERSLAGGHTRAALLKQKILESSPSLATEPPSLTAPVLSQATTSSVSQAKMPTVSITQQTKLHSVNNKPEPVADASTVSPEIAKVSVTNRVVSSSNAAKRESDAVAPQSPAKQISAVTSPPVLTPESSASSDTKRNLSPTTVISDQKNWLMEQPSEHYSIQLAQMRKLSSIQRFFEQYGLREQSQHYRSNFKSGPMYVLLFGSYPTLSAARAAEKKLPEKVRSMKPWIRKISSLQKSYKPVKE